MNADQVTETAFQFCRLDLDNFRVEKIIRK